MDKTEKVWTFKAIMKEIKTKEGLWSIILNCVGASNKELSEINEFIKRHRHIEVINDGAQEGFN